MQINFKYCFEQKNIKCYEISNIEVEFFQHAGEVFRGYK